MFILTVVNILQIGTGKVSRGSVYMSKNDVSESVPL